MFKHPLFWLGFAAFVVGLLISLSSCGISFEGAAKWTGLAMAGVLGAAMSPIQVIISTAIGFVARREIVGLVVLLAIAMAGDGFTSFKGFDARSAEQAQATSDRNTRYEAAVSALPSIRTDIAKWSERQEAMIAGLASTASADDVFAAQGLLVACVPDVYTETPDGKAGKNTLAGMRACASKANDQLARLEPEADRLQVIVEAGADTVDNGTGFWERIGLSIALIFFSNILALIGGRWMARALNEDNDDKAARTYDAVREEVESTSEFLDGLITQLARAA